MIGFPVHLSRRVWWVVALVGGLLIGLVASLVMRSDSRGAGGAGLALGAVTTAELRKEIDATCDAFGIDKADVRVRQEGLVSGEHRIIVDDHFRTLEFHYALGRRIARWGVTIAGEERPREKKVALRLLREGKQLWNVLLLIQKPSEKEDRHQH